MGYCIDDICHARSPICGAAGPYHCRADGGPSVDYLCRDDWCEQCDPDEDDECPDCGFALADDLSGTLERTPRSSDVPCKSCLWAHGPTPDICGWPLDPADPWSRCTRPADHEGKCA